MLYSGPMNLSAAVPVRLAPQMAARLRDVSKKTGIPVAALIRRATESYLDAVDRDGSINIPLRETPPAYRATPRKK